MLKREALFTEMGHFTLLQSVLGPGTLYTVTLFGPPERLTLFLYSFKKRDGNHVSVSKPMGQAYLSIDVKVYAGSGPIHLK